jgi:hypothetical protein
VDSKAGLVFVEKGKVSYTCQELNTGLHNPPASSVVPILTELYPFIITTTCYVKYRLKCLIRTLVNVKVKLSL